MLLRYASFRGDSAGETDYDNGLDDDDDGFGKKAMFGDAFGSRGDYSKGIFYGGRRKVLGVRESPQKPVNALELPEMFMTSRQTRKHRQQTNGFQFKLEFNVSNEGEGGAKQTKGAVKKQEEKKGKRTRAAMIVVDKYSSTNEQDWTPTKQAGCNFYVNHATGEATSEIPWMLDTYDDRNGNFSPSGFSSPYPTRGGSVDAHGQLQKNGSMRGNLPPIRTPVKTIAEQERERARKLRAEKAAKAKAAAELATIHSTDAEDEIENPSGTGALVYDGDELRSFMQMLDQHCSKIPAVAATPSSASTKNRKKK